MRIRRKLVYLLVILVCFILQTTVFQGLAIGSIVPNLLLIVTISFGFMRGKVAGMWTGFLCGILKDIFYGNLLGFYALIYLCIGYGAGCCMKIFMTRNPRSHVFSGSGGRSLRLGRIWIPISPSGQDGYVFLYPENHYPGGNLYGTDHSDFVQTAFYT